MKPLRTSHVAVAAVLAFFAFSGCSGDGQFGVNVPHYPGARHSLRGHQNVPGASVYRAQLRTRDRFGTVLAYYVNELNTRPGWSGPTETNEIAVWSNDNMRAGGMTGEVIDRHRRGAMVIIFQARGGTDIKLIEYVPTEGSVDQQVSD